MALLLWIVGAIGAAVIGMIITVLFQDQIAMFFAKVSSGFLSNTAKSSLSGVWYTYYSVSFQNNTSNVGTELNDDMVAIRLRQIGDRVAGVGAFQDHNYKISAFIREDYLTGTWYNFTRGRKDFGSFQLYMPYHERGMLGKFVGRDSKNFIVHGIWLWGRNWKELCTAAQQAESRHYVATASSLITRMEIKRRFEIPDIDDTLE